MPTYDDRLDGHDSIDSLMDAAEQLAAELAEEHYEECYEVELCGACIEDTPISGEWGPWMNKMSTFENLVQAVEVAAYDLGEEIYWIDGELSGTYLEAFRGAGPEPENCVVCTGQEANGGPHECGHTKWGGDECPARN